MSEFNPAFPGRLNCKNLRFTDVDTLSTEQILFDGYWEELINLYGVGLAYQVCRYDVTKADNLYGEHVSQAYADPVEILGLINLQENAVALSKYGFVTDDSITLYLHIRTYTETFSSFNVYGEPGTYADVHQKYIAPKAGDIFTLYEFGKTRPLGLGGKMFKVTERTDQDVGMNINQLAGHYVWVIQAKRYDPSYEPNVGEEKESYQIFDDPHTGRIIDGVEQKELPSEQKQYKYSVQQENIDKVFDYNKELINTNVYGGYLKSFTVDSAQFALWYATTVDINTFTPQPTTELIDGRYYQCIMQPEYGDGKQGIRIPSFYKLTKVEIYDKVVNEWKIIGGNAEYSTTLFNSSKYKLLYDGEYYDYTQYTYNGPTVGERDMKFYVSVISANTKKDVDLNKAPWYATIKGDGTFSPVESGLIDNEYYECKLAGEKSTKQAIQIPSQAILQHVDIYNIITKEWQIIGGNAEYSKSLFTPQDVILQIDGEHYDYTQYTYNGPKVGARDVRFYVTSGNTSDSAPTWYATSENIFTYTEQASDQFVKDEYFECELAAETKKQKQSIQIPANYIIKYVKQFNQKSNKWFFIGDKDTNIDLFDTKSITKNNLPYIQYTYSGSQIGSRILRFYI